MNEFYTKIDPRRETILLADSCAGGFGVLKKILPWAGDFNLLYLADSEFNPFGLKPNAQVNAIVDSWFKWATELELSIKALVVACNTASLATNDSIHRMSARYGLPVVTMIDGLKEMVEDAPDQIYDRTVGLMGTQLTINSGLYRTLIQMGKPRKIIDLVATQSESAIAHARILEPKGQREAKDELVSLSSEPLETVVLGCTCLEFIDDMIYTVFGSTTSLLNPADYVSQETRKMIGVEVATPTTLSHVTMLNTGSASWAEKMGKLSKHVFGESSEVTTITLNRVIAS